MTIAVRRRSAFSISIASWEPYLRLMVALLAQWGGGDPEWVADAEASVTRVPMLAATVSRGSVVRNSPMTLWDRIS
jgi:hypothetical protein